MRFFIADDDPATRRMLTRIIESGGLGEVVGEAEDGMAIDGLILDDWADILLIDLLMPVRDGIETIRAIQQQGFSGRIVMISQVESKDMVAEAYRLGVEYYIHKPINRIEVLAVLNKVAERIYLYRSLDTIRRSLDGLPRPSSRTEEIPVGTGDLPLREAARQILTDLGVAGEAGTKDLIELVVLRDQWEQKGRTAPILRDMYAALARRQHPEAAPSKIEREIKAVEQRIRRTVAQALTNIASVGLTDYSHPNFEEYAPKFFDFVEVRLKMRELQGQLTPREGKPRLNLKKFVHVLYQEAKIRAQNP
ncbi:MAG: response regulator [Alicyclobacillaceae bacterium]|nr:response regulator [Alicyclobacillaceae bacterium]